MSTPEREPSPPSASPPAGSGGGLYVAGMVVVGVMIVGLVMWQRDRNQQPTNPASTPVPVATPGAASQATSTVAANLPEFASPPILEEPEPEPAATGRGTRPAGAPAAAGATKEQPAAADTAPKTNCSACGSGSSNATLNGAIRSRAGTAQGCYQRALRDGGSQGTITVAVSVGSDGAVCGANVVGDTLNNPAIASCVIGKFRGSSYPPPTSGCVTVQVPITFKVK